MFKMIKEWFLGIKEKRNTSRSSKERVEFLTELCSEDRKRFLEFEDDDESGNIPYSTLRTIADMLADLHLIDFKINTSSVRFYVDNKLKNHILYAKESSKGIFNATFKTTIKKVKDNSEYKPEYDMISFIEASVLVKVPNYSLDNLKNDSFVITLETTISSSFNVDYNVNIDKIKTLHLIAASKVLKRASNGKNAEFYGIPKDTILANLPISFSDIPEISNESNKIETESISTEYSTADVRIDLMSDD